MKTFLIVYTKTEKANEPSSQELQGHADHLAALSATQQLVVCGPFKEAPQALLVLRADNLDEADQLIQSDPLVQHGFYNQYEIHEIREATVENHWLTKIKQS